MVRGAAVLAVALPAGGPAAGHAVFHDRRGGGRGDAGDRALDEHGFPRNAARPVARRDRPCFSYSTGYRGNQVLRRNGHKARRRNWPPVPTAIGLSTRPPFLPL